MPGFRLLARSNKLPSPPHSPRLGFRVGCHILTCDVNSVLFPVMVCFVYSINSICSSNQNYGCWPCRAKRLRKKICASLPNVRKIVTSLPLEEVHPPAHNITSHHCHSADISTTTAMRAGVQGAHPHRTAVYKDSSLCRTMPELRSHLILHTSSFRAASRRCQAALQSVPASVALHLARHDWLPARPERQVLFPCAGTHRGSPARSASMHARTILSRTHTETRCV